MIIKKSSMKSVESLLRQLGLAEEEIKIYLISLRKGSLTVQQLKQELDLSLLTINSAVHELISKKIIKILFRLSTQKK